MSALNKYMELQGVGKVEVISTGHFPDSAIVRMENGREIETEVNFLKPL